MKSGGGCNGREWERKIEDKEEASDSSFLKRENSREWRQFGYLAAGLFQVGCRSMFIHVKGWVVRGSGWLKDSGGGRGCNKRNGYSRAARMPSPRDDRRSVFTQQRVASYNRENAHPSSCRCLSPGPSSLNLAFIPFAVQRRRYFHYAFRFISICRCTGKSSRGW